MAWIALDYRGRQYTAAQLIGISKKFLEGTGISFRNYEIYDDCDMVMIFGVDEHGEEASCELPMDDLTDYLAE